MVRKSLLVAALLATATPVFAQEDYVWTSHRPDGHAPLGVEGGRTLQSGALEFTYRFSQLNSKGIWFQNDSLGLEATLEFYSEAPLTLSNQTHRFGIAFAASDALTFMANWSVSKIQREQITAANVFYVTEVRDLGDLEVSGLYNFYDAGPYKAHIQLGGRAPTGAEGAQTATPFGVRHSPYDQRVGGGTFAVLPGLTVQAQNEAGSVGAQMKADLSLGTNDLGFAPGDRFEATGWGAYRINEFFSASARVRWQHWGGVSGADPSLDPLQDPGNDGYFLEGERVDLPVGINFYLPEGSRFAGHRLAVEAIFPISHDYQGPQFGADWGVNVGWQVVF